MPLEFDQEIAQDYQSQLQIYQDKIDSNSISQTELEEARVVAGQYYQYLADIGIEYGLIAREVLQGSTFYGQYANGMLDDGLRQQELTTQQVENNRKQISISLAFEDATLRSQTRSGTINSRQIATYHYSILEENDLPREAWGGAIFQEFVGDGSWMDFREASIGDIVLTGFQFVGSLISSDQVINGVSRDSAVFRIIDVSSTLEGVEAALTGNVLIDGIKIISNFANTNPEDQVLVARDGDNILIGNRNQANTFLIPDLNGNNVISNFDRRGNIIFGSGEESFVFEGNAIPKKDANGNIIPNQWSLSDYDLTKSGDNLVITPAGSDISSPDTPRVTIANFPFDLENGNAFGLTLGKRQIEPPIYNHSNVLENPNIVGGPIFQALPNPRNEFMAIRRDGDQTILSKFNSDGNIVRNIFSATQIESIFSQEVDDRMKVEYPRYTINSRVTKALLPFSNSNDGSIGVASFDVDKEQITAIRTISKSDETLPNLSLYSRGSISSIRGDLFFRYQERYLEDNILKSRFIVHQISATSLEDVADPIEVLESELANYGGFSSGFNRERLTATLESKVKLYCSFSSPNLINIQNPALEDIPESQIPAQQEIAAGDDLETGDAKRLIITFKDSLLEEISSSLKITPNPDAILFIRNVNAGKVYLENFDLSEEEIEERTSQISAKQSSIQDLLTINDRQRREIALQELDSESDLDSEDEEKLEEISRRDEEPNEELIAAALENNFENYVTLELPTGQNSSMLLIFPATTKDQFLNETLRFNFVGYQESEIDLSTTNYPITLPNGSTSFFPEYPAINTTQNPQIAGPNPGLSPTAISAIAVGVGFAITAAGVTTYKLIFDEEFRQSTQAHIQNILSSLNPVNWFRDKQRQTLPYVEENQHELSIRISPPNRAWTQELQGESTVDDRGDEDELADLEESLFENEEQKSRPITPTQASQLQSSKQNQID